MMKLKRNWNFQNGDKIVDQIKAKINDTEEKPLVEDLILSSVRVQFNSSLFV